MTADEFSAVSAARRVRPLTVLAIAAAAVTVLLVAGLGVGRLMSQHRVDEELARIHAAGEPVTPDDLEAFYALPPGFQDTSALWLAAAKAVSQPGYDPDMLGAEPPNGLAWLLFRPADRAVFLQCMRELVAAGTAPDYPTLQAALDRTQRDVTAMMAAPGADWRYPVSKSILPSVDGIAGAVGRGTARREVARAAIAVERFRRANGRLPNGLKELVPEYLPRAPFDPFTGGPLHWVVSNEEYRVYSVGPNGLDEGGMVEEAGDKGDIFIRGRKR